MLKGSFFRLYFELIKDPGLGRWDWSVTPPVEDLGAMLNGWIVDAVAAFGSVPASQYADLAYEDLLNDPEATLLRFAGFVLDRAEPTETDRTWAATQAATIRPPSLKFGRLTPEEQARLSAVVAPARRALGYTDADS